MSNKIFNDFKIYNCYLHFFNELNKSIKTLLIGLEFFIDDIYFLLE